MVRIESLVINVTNVTPEQAAQMPITARRCNCKKCRERRENEATDGEQKSGPSLMDIVFGVILPAILEKKLQQDEQDEQDEETEEKDAE